ncbi:MAG: uncharacterized protein KVP18_002122 [Porospora cf. gigantea A]|uniref:uncharacterized protein n=1 Tax=Porospora cf. gigantea A TaxID=2853593 RepID=UPI00355A1562|nr:MAG: hypothetical protein KVP18_002122 [Porospora cf. gigantea A]
MLVKPKRSSVLQASLSSLVPLQNISPTFLEHATKLQPVLEALDAIRANTTFVTISPNDEGPPTITSCTSSLDDTNAQSTLLSKRKSKQFEKKFGFVDDALLTRCLVEESDYATQLSECHKDEDPLVSLDTFLPENGAEFTLVKVGSERKPSWYVQRIDRGPYSSVTSPQPSDSC